MRSAGIAASCALTAALLIAREPARAADSTHPIVVELFQSQGCSSCPPANANVLAIADRPDVLTLSWQVTYWDNLGWKDSFGDHAYTERQWDYARGLGNGEVYTPQVVVNGRTDIVGDRRDDLEAALLRADRGTAGPEIGLTAGNATVGQAAAGSPAQGEVLLVRYDPNIVQVPILRGENGGRMLPHRNVVREVLTLGAWDGRAHSYALPPAGRPGLKTAILVQSSIGGPILAAAHS